MVTQPHHGGLVERNLRALKEVIDMSGPVQRLKPTIDDEMTLEGFVLFRIRATLDRAIERASEEGR
jgi:hypothetical protein